MVNRFFIILSILSTLLYANVGKIVAVSGETTILRANQTIDATVGSILEEKDTI